MTPTTPVSFAEIFDGATGIKKIEIPPIQRDYAQGRRSAETNRVRERFLDALYKAVTEKAVTLDFIYGDIKDGVLIPLDGQQRLTTLFLLYWYAAKKENAPQREQDFLAGFSYDTRYSARNFCAELVKFSPQFQKNLKKEITNEAWFPAAWQKDPTVNAMLVMICAIDEKFKDVKNLWGKLKNGAITFYFQPVKDMGLTDDLYIKMNSRGKPLTAFEHFKAELERKIRAFDEKLAETMGSKIDREWTNLLWSYCNENHIVDEAFLRYFRFVCDVICYEKGESPQEGQDEFDLIEECFNHANLGSNGKTKARQNAQTVTEYFDCWLRVNSPAEFAAEFMCSEHETGKIMVDGRYDVDIFKDCLNNYSDKSGRLRQFPLNRMVLLYAVTCYLQNQNTAGKADFGRRLRIVNNLIQNSADEISDRADRNRMPAILAQTKNIILTGKIDKNVKNSFNAHQLREEEEKTEFLAKNPAAYDILTKLEDSPILHGQISILGLKNLHLTDKFIALFGIDWDKVDCALMTVGDYGQKEGKGTLYQYGSKNNISEWDALFHKSSNRGFEATGRILAELLELPRITDQALTQKIENFLAECENKKSFSWRYYYVKYAAFRPGKYGKYSDYYAHGDGRLLCVLQTLQRISSSTYDPYIAAADKAHVSREHYG